MKIIKRNGSEVAFDITKIIVAITKANDSVEEVDRMTPVQIQRIAESVELQCQKIGRAPTVEEIQDMVEHYIMAHGAFEVAKHYITYRYTRSLVRKSNTTDDKILSLIECITRRPSRRIPIKTQWSTPPSGTTWPVRSAATSANVFCCLKRLLRPIGRASSTSTTAIITPSICTTVTW